MGNEIEEEKKSVVPHRLVERMEDIFQSGLHEYIQAFLAENGRLGQAIHDQYLS